VKIGAAGPSMPEASALGPKAAREEDSVKAARQLEAYFLRQVLAEVSSGDGLAGAGFAADTFHQMFNESLADAMAGGGGIGLGKDFAAQLDNLPGASQQIQPAELAALSLGGVGAQPQGIALAHHAGGAGAPRDGVLPVAGTPATPASLAAERYTGTPTAEHPLSIRPVPGRITSRWGGRIDPVDGTSDSHPGIDLAAATGTPVQAAGPGVVVRAEAAGTYGNLVVIDHGDGLQTRYAHLSEIDVHEGDRIEPGQTLGKAGATGRVTGPHLHFEVRRDGQTVDPASEIEVLQNPVKDLTGSLKSRR
jgi:peptidase M23-like protein/rod binding protein